MLNIESWGKSHVSPLSFAHHHLSYSVICWGQRFDGRKTTTLTLSPRCIFWPVHYPDHGYSLTFMWTELKESRIRCRGVRFSSSSPDCWPTNMFSSPMPHGLDDLRIDSFLFSRRVLCLFPPLSNCIMVLLFPSLNCGCNGINSYVGCVFVHHAQLGVVLSPFFAYAIYPVVALRIGCCGFIVVCGLLFAHILLGCVFLFCGGIA